MLRSTILTRIKGACYINTPTLLQPGDLKLTINHGAGKFERPLYGFQTSFYKSSTTGEGKTQSPQAEPQKEHASKETISANTKTKQEEPKEFVEKQITPKHDESIDANTNEDLWSLIRSRMRPLSKDEQERRNEECSKIINGIFGEETSQQAGESLTTNDRFYFREPNCNITKESTTVSYKDDHIPHRVYETNEGYCKDYGSDEFEKPSLMKDNFRSILCNDAILIKENDKSTSGTEKLKSSDIKSHKIYDDNRKSLRTKDKCEMITVDSHWNDAFKDYRESSLKFDTNQAIDMKTIRIYNRIKANRPLNEEEKKIESKRLKLSKKEMEHLLFGNPYEHDFIRKSTTAKKDDEKLVQKIEHVDETPLVEACNPKIDGFHGQPKVLGKSKEMARKSNVDTVIIRYDKKPLAEFKAEHNLEHQTTQRSTDQRNDSIKINPLIHAENAKVNKVNDQQQTPGKSETIVANLLTKSNVKISPNKYDNNSLVEKKGSADPQQQIKLRSTDKDSNLTNLTLSVQAGNPKVDELHEQPKILQKLDNMVLHDVKSDKQDKCDNNKSVTKCEADGLVQTKPGSADQNSNVTKKHTGKDDLISEPRNMPNYTWLEVNDDKLLPKPNKGENDIDESEPNETVPGKVFNIHMDPKHVLTCNETCAISPNPLLKNAPKDISNNEVNSLICNDPLKKHDLKEEFQVPLQKESKIEELSDTTQLLQETTEKINKTTEKLQNTTEKLEAAAENLETSINDLKTTTVNTDLEEIESNKLSRQGALSSIAPPVAIPETVPKPDDKMKLSEILRLVRERNQLLNISNLEAKKSIPPLSQPMDKTRVFPAPDYQKLKPFPKICVPKGKPKKDKCIQCDLKVLGLDDNFRRDIALNFPENGGSVDEMSVMREDMISNSAEDVILQLQSIGDDLRAAYYHKKREILEVVMLMKSMNQNELSNSTIKLNRIKDYDPWNAIPSWPYWKKYERPKLQTPKDGCKFPPPSPAEYLPGGMRPSKTIPTFPTRVFAKLGFITVSLEDDYFENNQFLT